MPTLVEPKSCLRCGVILTNEKCTTCHRKHGEPSDEMPDFYCHNCLKEIKTKDKTKEIL